jgi:hypothetical protein
VKSNYSQLCQKFDLHPDDINVYILIVKYRSILDYFSFSNFTKLLSSKDKILIADSLFDQKKSDNELINQFVNHIEAWNINHLKGNSK